MTAIHERTEEKNGSSPKGKLLLSRLQSWAHSSSFRCTMLTIAAAAVVYLIFFFVCTPKKYDLREGAVAHETIRATRDVTDEFRTQEKKETAAAKIEPVYVYRNVKQDVMNALQKAFGELRAIQQYGEQIRMREPARGDLFTEDEIEYAAIYFLDTMPLTGSQIRILMKTGSAEFESMVDIVTKAVSIKMNLDLKEGETEDLIKVMVEDFNAYYPELDIEMRMNDIIPTVLRECIQPNYIIDYTETEKARNEAMDAVDPVIILQGEPVIIEGNTISAGQIQVLRSLNLLKDGTYDYSSYTGAAIAVVLTMLILLMTLKLIHEIILTDVLKLAVVLLIVILTIGVAAISQMLPSIYFIPLALGSILGTMLIGYRTGICLTFVMSLMLAFLTAGKGSNSAYDVAQIAAMTMAEGLVSIWFLKGHPQRIRVLIAGFLSALTGIIVLFVMKLLTSSDSVEVVSVCAQVAGGGLLSGLLAVAFQPAFEVGFRLATPSRLLELTNPNQPLMKRLMIEAPGTYHHSIVVANLAEAAADQIHANPYLARAGAYYHDIGKLKRPGYFKENQNAENPHEKTDPYISAAILISHTTDGVMMAQKERLPKEVQQIIQQHHGVTPVMYFYHKALQLSDGNHVDIDEFRYHGPKPDTKEAAVVMLADTIEAAVRSMKDPTPKGIDQFIERLVRGKLEDGQLSDSPLSLSDIDEICKAFSGILRGVYHERIEYPTVRHYAQAAEGHTQAAEESSKTAVASPEAVPDSSSGPITEKAIPVTKQEDTPNEN